MELLSPAGNLEKLKYAIAYGADAVYAGGKEYSLRAKADNFDPDELKKAVEYCHSLGKKLYITTNIFAHEEDFRELPDYLQYLDRIKVDAVIASDPGVISLIQEHTSIPIHISTQANVTSSQSVKFWKRQGIKRIILARELSRDEIMVIREQNPDIELEIFVHGAMCISYSGRCLLSAFLNQRSANRGLCTHPCRWTYSLVEESRPDQKFEIDEDERGTYILNSKDLCLLNRIEDIQNIGIDSIKIEGRMKSLYYVANVTRVYRTAIDMLKQGKEIPEILRQELDKLSHRPYTEGFYPGNGSLDMQTYGKDTYEREYQYIGKIIDHDQGVAAVDCGSKFVVGDEIEFIFPQITDDFTYKVQEFRNQDGEVVDLSKPNQVFHIPINHDIPDMGIIRLGKKNSEIDGNNT
ncbi:MAG TPA: U32 family peptidase C-terminal domain-containing protein [Candidatus Cloacimonadota bacterium]|nr:U32 family peptidase C-terminal domain-containing protein [Candidatus Cloacimonadota bacterium]HPT72248.1 U32 family peptidase C-terminal domain-containing protein [Candidatus Cloacimonadota bacterium]